MAAMQPRASAKKLSHAQPVAQALEPPSPTKTSQSHASSNMRCSKYGRWTPSENGLAPFGCGACSSGARFRHRQQQPMSYVVPLVSPPAPPTAPAPEAAPLAAALLLALCGSVSASFAHVLYRSSTLSGEALRPIWRRPRFWVANVLIVGVLTACNSVALSMAPLSLIAPFAGITMIWSAWLGHCGCFGVRERLTPQDVGSTLLVLSGALLVSMMEAAGHRPDRPIAVRLGALMDAATGALFVVCWLSICVLGYAWITPLSNGIRRRWPVGSVFCSAFLGASCAALTTAFVKLVATAAAAGFDADGGVAPPAWFVAEALAGIATCAPLDLMLLARTTGDYALALAVPIYQSMVVALSATAGGLFFSEFQYYDGGSFTGFIGGIVIVVGGVSLLGLSYARRQRQKPTAPTGGPPTTTTAGDSIQKV